MHVNRRDVLDLMSPFLSSVTYIVIPSQWFELLDGVSQMIPFSNWLIKYTPATPRKGMEKSWRKQQTLPHRSGRQRQISSNRRYPPSFKSFFRLQSERSLGKVNTWSRSFTCVESIWLGFCMWMWVKEHLSPNLLSLPTFPWEVNSFQDWSLSIRQVE